MTLAATNLLTVGQAAEHLGAQTWRVQRLLERGGFTRYRRVGRNRVIDASDLPQLRAALVRVGYLKETE